MEHWWEKPIILNVMKAAVVIAVILIAAVGFVIYKESKISIKEAYITNVTDTAFTIVWISEKPYNPEVVYQESGKSWIPVYSQFKLPNQVDDRENPLISTIMTTNKSKKNRYTHHVTIGNLKPDTKYQFKIRGIITGKAFPQIPIIQTTALREKLTTPDPAYGLIEGITASDSVFIIQDARAGKQLLLSTTLATNSTYTIDLSDLQNKPKLKATILDGHQTPIIHEFKDKGTKPLETIVIKEKRTSSNKNKLIVNTKAQTQESNAVESRSNSALQQAEPPVNDGGTFVEQTIVDVPRYSPNSKAITSTPVCDTGQTVANNISTTTEQSGLTSASGNKFMEVETSGRFGFFENQDRVAEKDIVLDPAQRVMKVRIYYDDNGNGQKDPNEKYMSDYNEIAFKKEAKAVKYRLNAGWNLVHIPLIDSRKESERIDSAKKLLSYWSKQGANIQHVVKFSNGRFLYASKRESGLYYSGDFPLLPGEGIFVFNPSTKTEVTFSGNEPKDSVQVFLNNGWNLVGIYSPKNSYTGESLITKMGEADINGTTVSQFENGLYQSLVKDKETLYGNDYNIINTKGYFIRVEQSTVSIPEFKP